MNTSKPTTVSSFIDDTDFADEVEPVQHYAEFYNTEYGNHTVAGWITSDGIIIFPENAPKFCPETGKPLTILED